MGFFSWKTQDTNKSIANKYSTKPTFTVYMVNPLNNEYYVENDYEGYGVFGGKDYYELLAQINNKGNNRDDGIHLAFSGENFISPVLVEDLSKAEKYYGQKPKNCVHQGYFY